MYWKKVLFIIGCLLNLISINSLFSQDDDLKYIQKARINERIFIVGIGDAITGVLTKNGIIVIDAGQSPTLSLKYRKIIEEEFKQNNFLYLLNTHSHFDHTGGNSVFTDAKIISHKNCITEINELWKNKDGMISRYSKLLNQLEEKLEKADKKSIDYRDALIDKCRYSFVLNDLKNNYSPVLPNITFSDSLSLHEDGLTLNLFYFRKAHTSSNILIHIPEEKTLFVGDLFSKGGNFAYKVANSSDASFQINLLNSFIKSESVEIVITGHGDVLKKDDLLSFCMNLQKQNDKISDSLKNYKKEIEIIENKIKMSIGWAKTKDLNLLYNIIADDAAYIEVQPSDRIVKGIKEFKKAEKFWMSPDFKAIGYEIRDLSINISHSGDVAWFFCILDDINEYKGKPASWLNTRWTGTLEKRKGNWVIIQMHFSFANK